MVPCVVAFSGEDSVLDIASLARICKITSLRRFVEIIADCDQLGDRKWLCKINIVSRPSVVGRDSVG
jgi:hypothetical protein